MQCRNCGFENLPGLTACGRCASMLDLSAIEIEPPRASRLAAAIPVQRLRHARSRWWRALRSSRLVLHGRWLPAALDLRTLAWAIAIPGMGQMRSGRRTFGRALLGVWLGIFLLFLLSLGTYWQAVFFMLLIVAHGVGVLAVFAANLGWEGLIVRVLFGFVVWFTLLQFMYRPAAWLAHRFASMQVVDGVSIPGALENGDGLLIAGPLLGRSFEVGDVVLYNVPLIQGQGWYVRAGQGCDRIIARAGDRVQITQGQLLVNGSPPPAGLGPLGPGLANVEIDIAVGPAQYVIVPSQFQLAMYGNQAPDHLQTLASYLYRVEEDEIVGRVIMRLRPFKRWGALK